jgi:hypothetical protein
MPPVSLATARPILVSGPHSAQAGGNISRAAELLDLNPTYLHRLIRNFKLKDRI